MTKPLSLSALSLLEEINDQNGGCMAVEEVGTFHSKRDMNTLSRRGLVGFVNYANGEHVCMTDAGLDALEAA